MPPLKIYGVYAYQSVRMGHLTVIEGIFSMAQKKALQRRAQKTRPSLQSPKRAEPEPRSRCIASDTQELALKARSTEEIAEHLQRSSKPVEWNTDEPDVD
jgi:hypothetical protein